MSELKIIRKRFIAAAVCPSCDEVDRIVVETAVETDGLSAPEKEANAPDLVVEELSRRRCVTCGFADEYAVASDAGLQSLPKGRPERPRSQPVNPVKVRILDPKESGL